MLTATLLFSLSAPPVLVQPCAGGIRVASESICTVIQQNGTCLYTTGQVIGASWCSHNLLTCSDHNEQGDVRCPTDQCTHVLSVYAWAGVDAVSIMLTPGIATRFEASDVWGHVHTGTMASPADFNIDGEVNSTDLFDFLTAFLGGGVDYDLSGQVDSADLFAFIEEFFA